MMGWVDYPIKEFGKKLLMYTTVYVMFFNWTYFHQFIYLFFTETFDTLGARIVTATSSSWFPTSINDGLGEMIDQGLLAMKSAFKLDGYVLPYILGVAIFLSILAFVGYATFLIALSKIGLTALIAIAPIFLLFILFDLTRGMFSAWLKQVFNFGFISLLTYTMLSFFLTLVRTSISILTSLDDWGFGEITPLILTTGIGVLVLLQVSQIASGLASGAQLTTLGAGKAASESMGRSFSSARTRVRDLANKYKERKSERSIQRK